MKLQSLTKEQQIIDQFNKLGIPVMVEIQDGSLQKIVIEPDSEDSITLEESSYCFKVFKKAEPKMKDVWQVSYKFRGTECRENCPNEDAAKLVCESLGNTVEDLAVIRISTPEEE